MIDYDIVEGHHLYLITKIGTWSGQMYLGPGLYDSARGPPSFI